LLYLIDLTFGSINSKLEQSNYDAIKLKLDNFMALNRSHKIDLRYVIMAPAKNVERYIKGAKDTKIHFDVNTNSNYSLQLGAFSE
jgi:hypothetical protein